MANRWLLDRISDLTEGILDDEIMARIEATPRDHLNEFGVDPFGFDPDAIKYVLPFAVWLYRNYFRVEVKGLENLPEGRFLLIGNHSGQIPVDAMMVATAVLLESPKPRIVRSMVERWSAELPFISSLFTRTGQVVGDPAVCRQLLNNGEGVMVFPEGVRGINKLFTDRYKLGVFGHGFMRLALETKSPIVPVAIVGAEEQAPAIYNMKGLARLMGLPALPLVFPQIIPLPLPVKYRIHVGEPLHFKGAGDDDDDVVAGYVGEVKSTIQNMLHRGLEERTGVFS